MERVQNLPVYVGPNVPGRIGVMPFQPNPPNPSNSSAATGNNLPDMSSLHVRAVQSQQPHSGQMPSGPFPFLAKLPELNMDEQYKSQSQSKQRTPAKKNKKSSPLKEDIVMSNANQPSGQESTTGTGYKSSEPIEVPKSNLAESNAELRSRRCTFLAGDSAVFLLTSCRILLVGLFCTVPIIFFSLNNPNSTPMCTVFSLTNV
jgi:hypothetical protein